MPTRPETLEEATAAVHLAVMLVQWFTSDAVRRLATNGPRPLTGPPAAGGGCSPGDSAVLSRWWLLLT
jgi:hypothetical protein